METPIKTDLEPLPDKLLEASPSAKLLWLWLLPKGEVSLSQQEIADALNVSQGIVTLSLAKLEGFGLLEQRRERANLRATLEALESEDSSVAYADASLPKKLLKESVPTKLAYLYFKPHKEVKMSSRELGKLLGLSELTAYKAISRLRELKMLEAVREGTARHGARYKVKALHQANSRRSDRKA